LGQPTYIYADGDPTGSADPLGLYAVKNGIVEVATTNIGIICGSLGSACTQGVYALLTCNCTCNGDSYVADATLRINGTLYYYLGNPKFLKTKPVDPAVIDPKTSIEHEWSWHLSLAIANVDPIIKELEAKSFQTKEDCQQTCGSYREWVALEFSSYLKYTQYVEDKKQKPLPPY